MKELILVGGGGHCKSVIDVVESEGKYRIKGVLDNRETINGELICGYPLLGTDEKIESFVKQGCHFLITVGQIKNNNVRVDIYQHLLSLDATIATVIASTAMVSKHAELAKGCVVMHQCVVNAGVKIGINGIVNTAAIIEHDSIVGNHCHISTRATINADCVIGDNCFIGSNAVINRGLKVGATSVIASLALVTKDLEGNKTYFGSPVS